LLPVELLPDLSGEGLGALPDGGLADGLSEGFADGVPEGLLGGFVGGFADGLSDGLGVPVELPVELGWPAVSLLLPGVPVPVALPVEPVPMEPGDGVVSLGWALPLEPLLLPWSPLGDWARAVPPTSSGVATSAALSHPLRFFMCTSCERTRCTPRSRR
jgi:hypothetical protein